MTPHDAAELASSLFPPVAERIRTVHGGPIGDGAFVLYWMRTAVRGHENPALDAALRAGARLGLPVFVYHAVSERYPFASDRHHRFILEGARDVAAELAKRGVGYALHVERAGHRGPHLKTLAERAALVVTEDMPVQPLTGWTVRLKRAVPTVPIWAVDTACVVPMRLVERCFDRAFAYRKATRALADERLAQPWAEAEPTSPTFVPPDLPFEPVDVAQADLSDLIAAADIDHSIAPVLDTPGGSRAGYARWRAFRDKRLRAYHRRRNDAAIDGVSRMSAYLHYGHVSPLRIARDVAGTGGEGADKYLDELLIWREMAYRWCQDHAHPHRAETLPTWARQTLAEHERDPRPALLSWEDMARAKSGDRLWDACQRSLLRHGELHNNVRMTWGKAVTQWTPDAGTALRALVDLNHRYALDGRDPASYGGLLWCLGGFDRPFTPARPILGTIRGRPTATHAKRLDMHSYEDHVSRPRKALQPSVVVVGAGIAGLACARTLHDHGLAVQVLDKARGPGGRTSTRRGDAMRWDHGAPRFTADHPLFARHVSSWMRDGVVARLDGAVADARADALQSSARRWYVGVPGMNAVAKHLAADLDTQFQAQVAQIVPGGKRWLLLDATGETLATADAVVVTAPGPQAKALLSEASPSLAQAMDGIVYRPAITLLAHVGVPVPFEGVGLHEAPGGVLGSAWRMASKPGRSPAEAWVAHADEAFAVAHLEDKEAAGAALLAAFADRVGVPAEAWTTTVHRWRYSQVQQGLGVDCVWDDLARLAVAGDGVRGNEGHDGVQSAYLSGVAAAARVMDW